MKVEFSRPRDHDAQVPHLQDEIYIVDRRPEQLREGRRAAALPKAT
jgi:hypothetical protein